MITKTDLVGRIWRLCAILRKDGITYQHYVTELTYLLFLKMIAETGQERSLLGRDGWTALMEKDDGDLLAAYKKTLASLGATTEASVRRIFAGARTSFREGRNLARVMRDVDKLDWLEAERDSFGDLYEGILQKNAEETKRGAGQYFTPRPLVEALVEALVPDSGDVVQDPAAGTGGFLIEAVRSARTRGAEPIVTGMENVPDTHRLLLMNLLLHGIDASAVGLGDTLSPDHEAMLKPTLILSNPPFGPAGGTADRLDLAITHGTGSFAPPFLEHCLEALSDDGRAAIVVPDSILYEGGRVLALRRRMLEGCRVDVVLRLPAGIFYAAGVKTHVIVLRKGSSTEATWFYDLRTGIPPFGRTRPFRRSHLAGFVRLYRSVLAGDTAGIQDGRTRWASRSEIAEAGYDLTVFSSMAELGQDAADDDGINADDHHAVERSPESLVLAATEMLETALDGLRLLLADLETDQSLSEEKPA